MIGELLQQKGVREALATRMGADPDRLQWSARALRGGIDSSGVTHITVRSGSKGKERILCVVLKRVAGKQSREAALYQALENSGLAKLAPSLLCAHQQQQECWLVLEAVRPAMRWPWKEEAFTHQLMETLCCLHRTPLGESVESQWNYEEELVQRGEELLRLLEWIRGGDPLGWVRGFLPAMRKLLPALPRLRRQLMDSPQWGGTFIHGDVHPSNVIVTKTRGGFKPVLLDWGRSRTGSPLEDVSSWLQSLGYWEPQARRRHDALLSAYLRARGETGRISSTLRDGYWIAAASNLLAGAITYHLWVAQDGRLTPRRRAGAESSLRDALRIVRRAYERQAAATLVSASLCK